MFRGIVKTAILLLVFTITAQVASAYVSGPHFPQGPDLRITPGKLCDKPVSYRYPERIAYCDRDVDYEAKEFLILRYDDNFGYSIQYMSRADFKIDHFIPLCAGGSNDLENLWPQHKSIYQLTDPIEPILCEKMAQGKLSQANAVKLIMAAKTNLKNVPAVLRTLQQLK